MSPFLLICFCTAMRGMKSLTKEKCYDLIDAFNSTSRYLDDILNIDNIHVGQNILTEYIPLNFNLMKLMLLILKQPFST